MTVKKYQILLMGQVGEGFNLETVKADLGRMFHYDQDRMDRLWASCPKVIKSNLDRDLAFRYQKQMERAGAVVRITSPGMEEEGFGCPACGKKLKFKPEAAGKKGKCPHCGARMAIPGSSSLQPPRTTAEPRPSQAAPPPGSRGPAPKPSSLTVPLGKSPSASPVQPPTGPSRSRPLPDQPSRVSSSAPSQRKKPEEGLTAAAQRALDQKKIKNRLRLKEWLRLLNELAEFDESADDLRFKLGQKATLFGIMMVIALAAGGLSFHFGWAWLGWPLMLAAAVLLGFGIFFYLGYRRYQQVDLANDFRLLLPPLLYTLTEDLAPKSRIRMNLDFSGPVSSKIVKDAEIPPGPFRKIVETVYQDPWFQMEALLAEGSRLKLEVANTYVAHRRSRKNPRGKIKVKTKWRKLVTVSAGITPQSDRVSFDTPTLEKLPGKVRIKKGKPNRPETAWMKKKFKFKGGELRPESTVTEGEVIEMFFSLLSALKPVQRT